MTQQLEVSILAAPVAAIDSRALSQAWYSALRLARDGRQTPEVRRSLARSEVAQPAARLEHAEEQSFQADVQVLCRHRRRLTLATCAGSDERHPIARGRMPRTTLAERIERAFSDLSGQPRRATLSMGRGNARVVVMLQTRGKRAMLLALCRPELRAVVGRALAEARLRLAARGIGVELQAVGGRGCS
jgi:hypothetical protein